jgi:DNA-binding MarR family transcriptional regulator
MKGWTLIAPSAALAPAAGGVTLGPGTRLLGAFDPRMNYDDDALRISSGHVEKVHEDFDNRVGKCQVLVALSTDIRKLQERESRGSKVKGKMAKTHRKLDAGGDVVRTEQQVNNLHHRTMAVLLAEESLTPPQFMTLSRLHEIDRACKMSELAGLIFMSPAVMTSIVDRLVNLGMMKRNFDDRDRRVVLLTITERGESALSRIYERLRDMTNRFSVCISATDWEAAMHVGRKYAEFLTEELKSLEVK